MQDIRSKAATIDDYSSLFTTFATFRNYSHYLGLFAIRYSRLFAIRDYSLFAVRVFQTPHRKNDLSICMASRTV